MSIKDLCDGLRMNVKIFIPETATIKQVNFILFWAKGWSGPEIDELNGQDGWVYNVYLKTEYNTKFQNELATAMGVVLECEFIRGPLEDY